MGLWDIDKIPYVGREKGPQEGLAFHYYDADKVVAGKKMKDWLRFGVAWWHTFDQQLVDPFGTGTAQRPWYGKYSDPEDEALAKVDYAFEFFQKLGVSTSLHDRDIAPEGDTLRETDKNLDKVVDKIRREHEVHRHQAANPGHLLPVHQPALRLRRLHLTVRRPSLRLRRRPAEALPGDRQAPGRRELRVLGRP